MRIFENWFSTFRPSIADYDYYIEFKKVHKNVENQFSKILIVVHLLINNLN